MKTFNFKQFTPIENKSVSASECTFEEYLKEVFGDDVQNMSNISNGTKGYAVREGYSLRFVPKCEFESLYSPEVIEPVEPKIGDFLTRDKKIIPFTVNPSNRDDIVGIYVGDNPNTGEKLFIPGSSNFTYNKGRAWSKKNIELVKEALNLPLIKIINEFCGAKLTQNALNYIKENKLDISEFPFIDFCTSYSAKGIDNWYAPSIRELSMISENYEVILNSVKELYPDIDNLGYWYWSIQQRSASSSWRVDLDSGLVGGSLVGYSVNYVVPFLAINM